MNRDTIRNELHLCERELRLLRSSASAVPPWVLKMAEAIADRCVAERGWTKVAHAKTAGKWILTQGGVFMAAITPNQYDDFEVAHKNHNAVYPVWTRALNSIRESDRAALEEEIWRVLDGA